MKKTLLALVILLGFQSLAFAQGLPSWSLWQNQRGSTLEVGLVGAYGSFQGTFINQAQGYQCKGIPSNAQGTNAGGAVAFAVVFVQCNSLTPWSGTVSGSTLRTTWTLVYTPPSGPPQKSQGSDTFTRVR